MSDAETRDRLVQTPRLDRRTVRFDLPAAARVDRRVERGAVPNFSTFVREAVDEKLAREQHANQ